MEKSVKKVMAFGTFDVFHPGHQSYLKQARLHRYAKHCGQAKKNDVYLIVVVARDKTVLEIKKQRTVNSERKRLNVLKKSGLADEAVLGNLKDKYAVIKKFQPDIIALGYDQKVDLEELKDKLKKFSLKTKIIRLKPYNPEKYKSSKIKMHKSVGAIIRNKEGKILMHERVSFPPGWACAAGHVEENEIPDKSIVREVKEETNLDIIKYKLLFHEFIEWNKCSYGVIGHDWFLFEVQEWEGEIFANEKETKNISWKTIEEIKSLTLEEVWEYWFKKLNIL